MTREILEKIIGNFSRDELAVFFRKKSTKFTQKMEPLDGYDGDKFGKFEVLGEIELKDRFKLVVVAVEKNDSLTERDSRKKQFELAKKIMQERFAFHAAAIFVFHDKKGSFRFSLIHRQYKGTKAEFGPFRRFTYFVSPQESNRTFLDRIGLASFESLDEIKEAFSVERVNKEFYNRIAASFYALVGKEEQKGLLKYPKQDKRKEFAVRLIGRIVFCWFLKKKNAKKGSLIPNDLLSSMAVNAFPDYYHTVLEPLFFEVLNTPMKERDNDFLESKGITSLVKTIPFLNGGLFDPNESDDFFRRNGGITQSYGIIDIPDEWFSDLFMTFEQYNFTIDENTPVDVELSIDPEMLGRIFENLLAEINPETGETARKQSGSFYTPRPIVEYMVDESLKAYLVSKTGIEESRVNALLSYNDGDIPVLTEVEKHLIMDALDTMNVLDPACGSGAFPMGVLQKAVLILERVDPDSMNWVIKIVNKIKDPKEKKKRTEELLQEDWVYRHKLGIIQNCIYGVDIQQIAVEISKLRFFLSLVVDASTDHEIKPLPNLEFKFVCANTLIALKHQQYKEADVLMKGSYTQASLFDVDIPALLNQMREMREEYFGATAKEKGRLKTKIRDVQSKLLMHLLPMGADSAALKLSKWDAFSHERAEFFDPEWMFGVKEGFDIVIGNPPYIQLQSNQGALAQKYENQSYLSFARTGDIYTLFYERGNELLRKGGFLCYITSNKWMRAKYGEKMRAYFLYRFLVRQIIDFGDSQIFEAATTYTNILLAEKIEARGDGRKLKPLPVKAKVWDLSKVYSLSSSLEEMLTENDRYAPEFTAESFLIIGGAMKKIKERIEQVGTPLREWEVQINRGILTGFNEAFIIDGATKDRLIKQDPKSVEIIKPLLRGRDIKKYRIEYADQWLINTHNGYGEVSRVNIDDYPAVKKHLDRYGEEISKRYDKGDTPYNLRNCAYVEEFGKEKIAYPETSSDNQFCLIKESFVLDKTAFFIVPGTAFLLSLLNSSVSKFYLDSLVSKMRGGYFLMSKMYVEQLPIPKPNKNEPAFETLVDCIQFCYEHDLTNEAKLFTDVVDHMVFDLYFEKEMKEAGFRITDRVMEIVHPFTPEDTDEFKAEYIKELYKVFKKDKTIQSVLIYARTMDIVRTIYGGEKHD